LPEEAKLFIYTPDHQYSIGAITSENNKGEKESVRGFASGLLYGDQVILEYYVPENVSDMGIISIAYVVHGYRYILLPDNVRDYGDSGNCQVNVNCPEGDNHFLEKNAIALIIIDGIGYCTGSLVNTTANDYRPLLLTADHCLDGLEKYDAVTNPNLDYYSFYWHYESPGCRNAKPTKRETSGAKVIANSDNTDFALLELTEDPLNKRNVTPYYLGWDASGNPGTGGVCIHHPKGDIKKISTYSMTPIDSYCAYWEGVSYSYLFWDVKFIATPNNHSVTQNGSSGSPLINSNSKIIGQLFGPYNPDRCPAYQCDNPSTQQVAYGKFSISWNWYSDTRRQLKHWLDPNNTGVTIHHGTFDCKGNHTINNKTYDSSTNTIIEEEYCTITITNTTYNNGVVAKYYVGNKIFINPNTTINPGSSVLFAAKGVPEGTSREYSSPVSRTGEESHDKEEMITSLKSAAIEINPINAEIKLYPNPNPGIFQLETNFPLSDIANLKIINLLGATIYETQNLSSNTIQLPNFASGLHFVVIILKDGSLLTQKTMVQR
jgi:hypothetical protein